MRPLNHAVPTALRTGQRVRDTVFDEVYPADVRRVSPRFWTPIEVIVTADRWLGAAGAQSLLDVGSGAGKFCIVSNLASGRKTAGVEQRAQLLETARAAAAHYGATVDFKHGTLEVIDPRAYDAFYLFNPFGENLYHPEEQFDAEPELSALRYLHDLSIVEHWLDEAPQGTCFVTYHGFGGRIPDSYQLLKALPKGSDQLRLWRKTHDGRSDSFTLETDAARAQTELLPSARRKR